MSVTSQPGQRLDYYWDRLTEGGDEQAQQRGWLKDRFEIDVAGLERAAKG